MNPNLFLSEEFIFFTTKGFSLYNETSVASASKQLHRFAERRVVRKVTRGIWANPSHPYFTPLGCVPHLLGPEQGYVSFLTALHRHGIISQIPTVIQVATTGHPRILRTEIGRFEFFQLNPRMMSEGVTWSESRCPYRVASPEKALLDTLYLSTRKGRRFTSLPEFQLQINERKLKRILNTQVKSPQIKTSILSRLERLKNIS